MAESDTVFDLAALGNPYHRKKPEPLYSEDAEQGLLGTLLIDNRVYERVSGVVKAEHFYAPVNGRIFAAVETMINRGGAATAVTLKSYFADDDELKHLGGGAYLADLAASVVTLISAADYAETIRGLHLRREIVAVAEFMKSAAESFNLDETPQEIIEQAEASLYMVAGSNTGAVEEREFSSVLVDVITTAEAAYRGDPKAFGVRTGLKDLDRKMSLLPSDLLVLAGRPSMGKTALATNIAFQAAREYQRTKGAEGAKVAFYSMEMSAAQLGHRIACQFTGLDSDRVAKGQISSDEFRRFIQATQELASLPFWIDDTPALSIGQMRTRARRVKRKRGLGLIVVDYVQLMRGTGSRQSLDSRANEIAEISRGLKALAKELEVPVLALAQVGRAVELRDDKRPQLSDLKESGSLEQDADVVMFVFRDEYYIEREGEPTRRPGEPDEKFQNRCSDHLRRSLEAKGIAEVILGKQRKGPTGIVKVGWDGPTTSFSDLSAGYELRGQ